jgi:hypothetical protein
MLYDRGDERVPWEERRTLLNYLSTSTMFLGG